MRARDAIGGEGRTRAHREGNFVSREPSTKTALAHLPSGEGTGEDSARRLRTILAFRESFFRALDRSLVRPFVRVLDTKVNGYRTSGIPPSRE